jgi:hypothetical protein
VRHLASVTIRSFPRGGSPSGNAEHRVSHNGKNLNADVVVESLKMLDTDVFDRLLNQTESREAAGLAEGREWSA